MAASPLASAQGDHLLAARMVGFADSAFAAIGLVPDPDDAEELSTARAAAVDALGDARFTETCAKGAALADTEVFGLTWTDAPGR
ncbi:hypothetical protein JOF56_009200 [Kibdelosporangium banguiense]|uniref:DUF4439 domain-containing protein n=1 Tax=Kibdelosporangium banguiense TaxID=1365924 RepID=A0ABS4TWP1_9PSEU|nr:hypothetical protein [Kibdelosporangium banguiense]MBP2328815.1 hypothetical protein [Kibdelosporangium banguiense]